MLTFINIITIIATIGLALTNLWLAFSCLSITGDGVTHANITVKKINLLIEFSFINAVYLILIVLKLM